jgi:hypothetical protein
MDVVRGNYLKGGGAAPHVGDLLALGVYTVGVYLAGWFALGKRVG